MEHFPYRDGQLYAEGVAVSEIAAAHGTPCYIYSRAALEEAFGQYQRALADCDHLVCYAVKANSNLAVLDVLARLGAGFDIVSGGELERVIAAGGDPAKIVFSGVGKTPAEMARALAAGHSLLQPGIRRGTGGTEPGGGGNGRPAPVSVRVNPDVDARTHPYISTGLRENKFGVEARQRRCASTSAPRR